MIAKALKVVVVLLVLQAVLVFGVVTWEAYTPSTPPAPVVRLDGTYGFGSGVVISKAHVNHGTCKVSVVTAKHVAKLDDLALEKTPPFVTVLHPEHDIALVIFRVNVGCSYLGYDAIAIDSTPLRALDELVHVGFPHGSTWIARGTYVAEGKFFDMPAGVMTSAAGPGSSGGGVFRDGRLVGILIGGESRPPFRNYFVPIARLYEIVPYWQT